MEMVTAAAEEYLSIPVGAIAPSGFNPRRTFEPDGLAELADSLRTVGMIEPLIVRRGVDGGYLLVAGERRWRAAQLAGMDVCPVVVRTYDDRQAREVQLVENLQRKNVDAIQEAEGFRELMKDYGYTAEQIAARLGKKARVIYQRLALIELPAAVKDAVGTGQITTNHAILIARLRNPDHQAMALGYATEREGVGVRDLDHWIKSRVLLKLDAAPFDRADAELTPAAGSCEACPRRSGNARELFPEITSPDVCTDRACFDGKVQAHVARELRRNRDLVRVKGGWGYWKGQPKHVLEIGQYIPIRQKKDVCGSAAAGIVVFGDGIGTQVQVCTDPLCGKHKRRHSNGGGYERSAAEKAKVAAANRKVELARAVRGRVVDAILDAGTTLPNLLAIAVESWWENMGSDYRRLIGKRHPEWDADLLPIGDLPEKKLERLLMEFSLVRDLTYHTWSRDAAVGESLRERAEAAGVNWKAIEKDVAAEMAAPKKKGILAEVFAGVESDNGVEIQLRARAKGPVLAEIVLGNGQGAHRGGGWQAPRKKRLADGWTATIKVALKGGPERSERLYADTEKSVGFEGTTPALFAAYTRIGELAVGLGKDVVMVRDWSARKLGALARAA
jgi:ParB/RepB/Spo0J family partition protein